MGACRAEARARGMPFPWPRMPSIGVGWKRRLPHRVCKQQILHRFGEDCKISVDV